MSIPFTALDHVQLAMPKGEETAARRFYCEVLGVTELPKPPILAKRGGCWFASGSVQIHLGVEADFRPAKKAHPALRCADYASFAARLQQAGVERHCRSCRAAAKKIDRSALARELDGGSEWRRRIVEWFGPGLLLFRLE